MAWGNCLSLSLPTDNSEATKVNYKDGFEELCTRFTSLQLVLTCQDKISIFCLHKTAFSISANALASLRARDCNPYLQLIHSFCPTGLCFLLHRHNPHCLQPASLWLVLRSTSAWGPATWTWFLLPSHCLSCPPSGFNPTPQTSGWYD